MPQGTLTPEEVQKALSGGGARVIEDDPLSLSAEEVEALFAGGAARPITDNATTSTLPPPPGSPQSPGGALSVASTQAQHVLKGIPQVITGIPSTVASVGSNIGKGATDPASFVKMIAMGGPLGQTLIEGGAGMLKPLVKGARELLFPGSVTDESILPDSPEFKAAAEGAGANFAGSAIGASPLARAGIGKVAGGVNKLQHAVRDIPKDSPPAVLAHKLDLNPSYAATALSELKAAKTTVVDVPTALEAIKQRKAEVIPAYNAIVAPTSKAVVPGSASAMMEAELAAIPEHLRLRRPAEYTRHMKRIQAAYANKPDFTRGELDGIRRSLGAADTGAHGKSPLAKIAQDETSKALDLAAEQTARRLFFDALQQDGTGVVDLAKSLNQSKAALMHLEEALDSYKNQSFVESNIGKAGRLLRTYDSAKGAQRTLTGTVATPLEEMLTGQYESINKTLADTVRRWQTVAPPTNILPSYSPPARPQLTAGFPLAPPPDASIVGGSPALAEAGTRATRRGLLLPEPAPPQVAVPGGPVTTQAQQVRGVDAASKPLPMQPSSLDFGSGRVPTSQNFQYTGEAATPPLMKPSGPGTLLTRDPRVLKSTLDAIDKTLQSKVLNDAHRAELMAARAKILAQLQPPSPLAPPPTQ